jgi:phenylalanyl-tRNA synthetase alpha chain
VSEPAHVLDAGALKRALGVRDLTDPHQGAHAMQRLIEDACAALAGAWQCELRVERGSPIVSVADNYDRLHYPSDGAARDARYTRYVCEGALLRTQTSALVPAALRELAREPSPDTLLICPGIVYRRDSIDRLHTSEPHQLDIWRIARDRKLDVSSLHELVALLTAALLPGRAYRCLPAVHPYTTDGLQMDVRDDAGAWVEIGECGCALPALLAESGLPVPPYTGLALGLGLDRVLMLRKGIDDVRLLRAKDPRIAAQLEDLSPYKPVSAQPAVRRDLSVVVDETTDAETLGDAVREALGDQAEVIESVEVIAETSYLQLPAAARERLGIAPQQKNALVRVVLRALDRSLTHEECNRARDRIYAAIHRGARSEWAARDYLP